MTVLEFETFLKDAGDPYEIESKENSKLVWFRDRGNTFCGHPSETDPAFLYLTIDFPISDVPEDAERLTRVMNEIEDDFKLVKLKCIPRADDDGPFIRVATEQFTADANAAAAIFWRSIDLMREAGNECHKRLIAPVASVLTNEESKSFVERLENALQNGCDSESPAETPQDSVRAAIALVLDGLNGSGSAFCISSTSTESPYLTNAHVVGDFATVTVYRQCPTYSKMTGTIVAKGDLENTDLAILSVPVGGVEPVIFSRMRPRRDVLTISRAIRACNFGRQKCRANFSLHRTSVR